uniref:Ion transport domain-containing protein n=1 Tax=Zooxanthella nutricula TaxID=1333877 RepID=A0A7S2Q4F5_9DINO
MGISIDFEPSHPNWMVLEVFCTVVFVLEAVLKITVLGWKYFTGPCRYWNIADLAITLLSVVETSISTYIYSIGTSGGAEEEIANFARLAVVARVLRIARIMRIIRLVQTPLLKDFVNMTLGFAIGMPALFCVLCCFCVILFTFGLLFRTSFGPLEGQDEISVCGDPDNMSELVSDVGDFTCHAHYMYGEEYFGSMRRSMFTSFRFMLGDYSTRGGKSLIVAFSQGYGYKFDAVFVVWMIIVVFGFFNIVTAIFVDSTTSGLKHSDVKRRHEQQYARKYVQRKFRHLMHRVLALKRSAARGSMSPARSQQEPIHRAWLPWAKKPGSREFELEDSRELDEAAVATMEVTEKEFVGIMGDPEVQQLLQDLDIDSFNPAGWYDTFDPEGKGSMTLLSLLQSVMRLRGQPQKNDAIAAFLSLRALHAKVDDVQHSMLQAVARRSP